MKENTPKKKRDIMRKKSIENKVENKAENLTEKEQKKEPTILSKDVIKSLQDFTQNIKDIINKKVDDEEIKETVKLTDIAKLKHLNEHEVEKLRSIGSEYLSNFVIMGYDIKGERVIITSCKTSEEKDSILMLSQQVPHILMQMFNKHGN